MSPVTTFISRKVEVPCGDSDLYAFLTDMNNLRTVLPSGSVTDWEATEERCSFETDRAGRITVTRAEALPHSEISYGEDHHRIHQRDEISGSS